MSKHNLSGADELYRGVGHFSPMYSGNGGARGAPVGVLTRASLGSPAAADVDLIMDAATSTELPNNETVTYTTADDGTTPFDNGDTPAPSTIVDSLGNSVSVWALDAARNLSVNVTHGSSIVAMTVTITGYDEWGQKVVEDFAITATGTSKTVAGKKAFKYVEKIEITSASDAEANTCNIGTGTVFGLPYKLANVGDLVNLTLAGVPQTTPTTVAAVTTDPATATTGDVRGTVTVTAAGTEIVAWFYVADPNTEAGLRGVNQFSG